MLRGETYYICNDEGGGRCRYVIAIGGSLNNFSNLKRHKYHDRKCIIGVSVGHIMAIQLRKT